jgi:hypothetical protein
VTTTERAAAPALTVLQASRFFLSVTAVTVAVWGA